MQEWKNGKILNKNDSSIILSIAVGRTLKIIGLMVFIIDPK